MKKDLDVQKKGGGVGRYTHKQVSVKPEELGFKPFCDLFFVLTCLSSQFLLVY